MRGIGRTLSRLPAATAFLAGAALLAGSTVTRAEPTQTQGADEVALAVPRIQVRGAGGVALPQPLAPEQAARLKRIFALQRSGRIPEALRECSEFDTQTELARGLLGHVLAQRYLGPATRPGPDELRTWLAAWSDLPDAGAIRSLLIRRMPRGAVAPAIVLPAALHVPPTEAAAGAGTPAPEEAEPEELNLQRNPELDRDVRAAARIGAPAVRRLLARTRGLSLAYASQLRGEAAQVLFTLNRDRDAFDLAVSEPHAAIEGLAAGLAAWRMDRLDDAKRMFAAAWHAEIGSPAQRAAAAFWLARAHLRAGDPYAYMPWMHRAARQAGTFYGLIARRTLGQSLTTGADDAREVLGEADVAAIAATANGLRAFALLQVGETDRAEAELRLLWPKSDDPRAMDRSLMLVADVAGMPGLAAQLADYLQALDGQKREVTRFGIPRLRPDGGFRIDPALLFAVVRAESGFDTEMKSPAGARGLMQIMPQTASFIQPGASDALLRDPGANMDLGQRYISYLAGLDLVHGDLLRVLAAYNAGPGALSRWDAGLQTGDDPLLWIEALPVAETRAYVPRVLTYAWLYAARLRETAVGLDELAAQAWPRYREPPHASLREAAVRLH